MRSENSGWGAPKIHGELLKLGFRVSERTVAGTFDIHDKYVSRGETEIPQVMCFLIRVWR